MGLMNWIKETLNINSDDSFIEDEENGTLPGHPYEGLGGLRDYDKGSNKVVSIPVKTQFQVVLIKPESFDNVTEVADQLNERKTVVLNIESMTKDVARRWIDFLTGVAYANRGQMKKIANSTYIITPYNVDLTGGLLDELESNGLFFG